MAEHYLVVIPLDPNAELIDTAEAVRDALAEIADSKAARIKNYGKLQFIDAGETFEQVACPHCTTPIENDLWQGWMASDWHGEDGFHLHQHETPCCGRSVSLNDLSYTTPQGFAKWFVSAQTTGRAPLSADELAQLERIAGIPIKAISQKY